VAEAEAVDAESRAESPRDPTPPAARHALFALARASRRRAALEVGTGDGAATLFLGEALRQNGGRVLTVERDSARYARAVRHVARAGLAGFVDLRLGEAERVVPRLDESYDLVVLDASPSDRVEHLALVEGACRRGAVIVSCGAAAHASELATYQATVRTHPLVVGEATVPVGDGLGLALLARRPSKRPVDHRA
jgi:predicted O-methyltransferase YrrM